MAGCALHNGFLFHKADNEPANRVRTARAVQPLVMALGDPVLSLGLVGLLLCESPPLEVQLILIHVLRIRWLVFLDRVMEVIVTLVIPGLSKSDLRRELEEITGTQSC